MQSTLQALAPRRQAFLRHYLSNGFNGALAAREAGYAVGSAGQEAHRLLNNAQVQSAFREVLEAEEGLDPRLLTAFVRHQLLDVARDGPPRERVRALELIGRMAGML